MDGTSSVLITKDGFQDENQTSPGQKQVDPAAANLPEILSTDEQECLRTLCIPEIDIWQQTVLNEQGDESMWLFQTPQYHAWEDIASNHDLKHTLLWVKGKPGAGKSTLLKTAISRLGRKKSTTTTTSSSRVIQLVFPFNAYGVIFEKSALGLFKSILFQLCQQSIEIRKDFMPKFRRKKDFYAGEWSWTEMELKSFIMTSLTRPSKHGVYLLVDALDQCQRVRELVNFLESVRSTAHANKAYLRIFYSSRYYPHVQVQDCVELQADSHNSRDIEAYVEEKLEPVLHNRRHIDQIKHYIIEKARGVFLWVVLVINGVIEAISDGRSAEKLVNMVETTPEELERLYKTSFDAAKAQTPLETCLLLRWLLYAARALTLRELRYALMFQDQSHKSQHEAESSMSSIEGDHQMDLLLKASTGGLTEIRKHSTITYQYAAQIFDISAQSHVFFMHESVTSFLLNQGGPKLLDSPSRDAMGQSSEQTLAEACLNYLRISEMRTVVESHAEPDLLGLPKCLKLMQELYEHNPFLHYAIHAIFKHLSAAEKGVRWQTQPSSLYERMTDTFPVWRYLFDLDSKCRLQQPQGPSVSLIYLAAEYNIVEWVDGYIASGGDVDVVGGQYGTMLQAAIVTGNREIVELLLQAGADADVVEGRFGTPLAAACWQGDLAISERLLQRGCYVNNADGDYGHSLQAASCSPNSSVELVLFLLEAGADILKMSGRFGTALQAAAYTGKAEIVLTLLENGADVNAVFGMYGTALGAAAYAGHEQIVDILICHGADLMPEVGDFGGAVWSAAYQGHENVLRRLLSLLNPSWQDNEVKKQSLELMNQAKKAKELHEQVELADDDQVGQLIEDGVDVNARGGSFSSALHTACFYGHTSTVLLLLKYDTTKLDVRDYRGRTPLWHAASNGHAEIAREVLATGRVDVHCKPASGRNILWFAACGGDMEMIRIAYEAGVDPHERDADGRSPLDIAREQDQMEVLSYFDARRTQGSKVSHLVTILQP